MKLPLKNNEQKFGWPAQLMHWIMAIVIIGMIVMGLKMVTLPNGLDKLKVYGWHKATGILIFIFVIFRLIWRQFNFQPHVPHENGRGIIYPPHIYKLMDFFAHYWHIAIYAMIIVMPLSGWLMSSSFGFPVSVFGWFTVPNLVPPSKENADLFKSIHDWTSYLLIGFIIMHIFASLFHHYILKDIVMKRMLPVIAIILFATPAFAAQKWEVDKAKSYIKFEATQNNAPVIGDFTNYQALIEFDPKDLPHSKVNIEIKMDGISSAYEEMVSYIKMPDWFDVKKFPVARFEILKFSPVAAQGMYKADGNLTIRDITKPETLVFGFKNYDAKRAVMETSMILKRTDFGVGQGEWKDVNTVKDQVTVMVHIEADAVK